MNMDDKNSNQYKNVFDENGCMKCRDPNWRQKQLSVVTRRLDKLIQYIDFIKDERLLLYLTDSEKMTSSLKFILCAKIQLPMK